MVTLSSVIVSVPIGVAGGLLLGVLANRSRGFRMLLFPILDLMQTVPVFAYLVPILVLFGFGPVAAMIATIIYAMPPMVRVTVLSLEHVPHDVLEFGQMAGCTRRQLTWKVRVPSALPGIMMGVNQVIMLSLNMVIIASMIGAGGLGFDVLSALRNLNIGKGVEAGVAITLMAVTLDRLSQAAVSNSSAKHRHGQRRMTQRKFWLTVLLVAVVGTLVGEAISALATFPESWTVTTAPYWDQAVTYINIHFYNVLEAIKAFLLINIMVPFKRLLISLPWTGVVALVGLAGLRLGGLRLALSVTLMTVFIAATGNWEKAMVSTYLCGTSVVIACLIGIPIGIWSARSSAAARIVEPVIDTLQTLPSFVYLIPVVMLFQVGDFSAMIAIVAYAIVPAIRYTDHGIRKIPTSLTEAATASGCTRRQLLWKVQLPLAVPEILLGVNQTIMMALSMLVITALVGTSDLGQQVYIALTNADSGQGVVAGVCVAFLAMIADRLIAAGSSRLKEGMGLAK
jgi:glycine betaine/proline transport system permease protein